MLFHIMNFLARERIFKSFLGCVWINEHFKQNVPHTLFKKFLIYLFGTLKSQMVVYNRLKFLKTFVQFGFIEKASVKR